MAEKRPGENPRQHASDCVFPLTALQALQNRNFWTDDAEEVQAILKRFERVVVIHGHTHQLLTNRIGNIHFHGLLSTAWPWPYAPMGMPALTVHDADLLGSTVGGSCDMCHPHAANTHPETYPKFQVQLGRVALLRDMINWCIEQPLRGQPMSSDDPRMRALEAYIAAQRSGVQMQYGKH